jgi:hypothetical protein
MTNPEDKPKEMPSIEVEKTVQTLPEKTPTEIRQERLTQINQELSGFSYQSTSPEDIQLIQGQREQEYQAQLSELETGLETGLSEESKEMIHKNMVDIEIEQAQKENDRFDRLHIQKTILKNIENKDFGKKISPTEYENLTEESFEKALDQLLEADIDLPRNERIKLFRQTLEYYASEQPTAEKPVWHSTSSFSLRKGLEEGFSGGKISGGESASSEYAGKPLSITHPDYPTAEDFQEMFARLCAKGSESLSVNSEGLTGDSLPKVFYESFLRQLSENDKKELIARRLNLDSGIKAVEIEKSKIYDEYEKKYGKEEGEKLAKEYFATEEALKRFDKIKESTAKISPNEITDEMISRMTSPEAISAAITDFEQRSYVPPVDTIEREVLPTIENQELREELRNEVHEPFPCMITFELAGKEKQASSIMKGESPTHIPFEDHFFGVFTAEDIKEVRVPLNQMEKTRKWLEQKGLSEVNIVPIEVYEVKRLIEDNIKK